MNTLLIIALIIAVAGFAFARMRRPAKDLNESTTSVESVRELRASVARKSTPFHAVSIKFDQGACPAAKEMAGRRFLSGAAPKLPLPECQVLECNCRFVHHKDRRAGSDRRSPFQGGIRMDGTGTHEQERRENADRRTPDSLDDDLL